VEVEGKFIRQSGGRGQYGHVLIKLEPMERSGGFQFVERIKGGALPKQYIQAAEVGIKEAMETGVVAGYPMVDVKATLYDGSYHEVDSSDIAFKMAGSMALRDGAAKAKPILLEPIMKIEIVAPEQFLGDIMGDLNSRRGHIDSVGSRDVLSVIRALVPLAETFGYATNLRSLTQGRAAYSLEFDHYDEVPAELADQITGKAMVR
jgi:elongation factor G